jgi:sugar transferase (PEP-CTERM/EpsH1 system associated)
MRILWVKTELLHPVDKGGKIRTLATLRELRKRHHVTYVTLDDGHAAPDAAALALAEYCHDVVRVPFAPPPRGTPAFYLALARNLLSPLPYAIARYRSGALRSAILRLVREREVDLVVCDFLAPSLNVPADLGVPMVLFQHNVEAAIWERHAAVARNPVVRAYFGLQWRRMRAWEGRECRRFDRVIAVSEADAASFTQAYGVAGAAAVPTGVDVDYFRPSGRVAQDRREILFVGSMDWMPNEDGIRWFTDEVLPLVRARVPDAHLTVVGRKPSERLRALAATGHVTVTGTVPDVRPWLERASVVVVPLRVGGGTRLKIYEGMAMERATVSTTVGAEGLPLRPGEDILIADSAGAFADAVAGLLLDPSRADALGRAAAGRVRREFSWEQSGRAFEALCLGVRRAAAAPAGPTAPDAVGAAGPGGGRAPNA